MSAVIPSKQLSLIGSGGAATDMIITNKTITLANTENSHILQNNLKQLIISCRTPRAALKCSLVLGESGTKYKTVPFGSTWTLDGLDFVGKTLYIQATLPTTIVEIVELI